MGLLLFQEKKNLQNTFFVWNHNHRMKSHLPEVTEERSHWTSRLSAQSHSGAQALKKFSEWVSRPLVAGSCLMTFLLSCITFLRRSWLNVLTALFICWLGIYIYIWYKSVGSLSVPILTLLFSALTIKTQILASTLFILNNHQLSSVGEVSPFPVRYC